MYVCEWNKQFNYIMKIEKVRRCFCTTKKKSEWVAENTHFGFDTNKYARTFIDCHLGLSRISALSLDIFMLHVDSVDAQTR